MKLTLPAIALASLATFAAPVAAQSTEQTPQAPAPVDAATVSDSELENFVIAASMIQQVQASEEIPAEDKDQAMVQILSQAQMTPTRFNGIAAALQADEQLQARVSQTVERLQAQAEG